MFNQVPLARVQDLEKKCEVISYEDFEALSSEFNLREVSREMYNGIVLMDFESSLNVAGRLPLYYSTQGDTAYLYKPPKRTRETNLNRLMDAHSSKMCFQVLARVGESMFTQQFKPPKGSGLEEPGYYVVGNNGNVYCHPPELSEEEGWFDCRSENPVTWRHIVSRTDFMKRLDNAQNKRVLQSETLSRRRGKELAGHLAVEAKELAKEMSNERKLNRVQFWESFVETFMEEEDFKVHYYAKARLNDSGEMPHAPGNTKIEPFADVSNSSGQIYYKVVSPEDAATKEKYLCDFKLYTNNYYYDDGSEIKALDEDSFRENFKGLHKRHLTSKGDPGPIIQELLGAF